MRLFLLLPCVAALLSSLSTLHADEFYYMRDTETELLLNVPEGEEECDAELRSYEDYEAGKYNISYEKLKRGADGGFSTEIGENGAGGKFVVSGKPGSAKIKVAAELHYETGGKFSASGDYRLMGEKERLNVASERSKKADKALNKVYAKVKEKVGEIGFPELRDHQIAWLEYRKNMSVPGGEKPEQSVAYWNSFTDITLDRCEFLPAFTGENLPEGISGTYKDNFGGELKLEESEKDLKFTITVVRGPSSHVGDMSGLAQRKGDRALFRDKPEAGEDRKPAELSFVFRDGHKVEIKEQNTEFYRGARAYFQGDYFKTGALKEPIELN